MKKQIFYLVIIFSTLLIETQAQKTYHPWEAFELELQSGDKSNNPYLDHLNEGEAPFLQAEFTNQASGEKIIIPGFWDGASTWKVRFSPPKDGIWIYNTISSDKKMNNRKGKLQVIPWTSADKEANRCRHGFIYVNKSSPRAGRYFVHADQTPFLWIGDTWWNWTKREIRFETFRKLADDRAAKGFTVGQLFFAGNGWGGSASLIDESFENPDIQHIQQVEKMIEYANTKGIIMWIHPIWSRENLPQTIPPEKLTRWWRYVVHRLSAYNVIWVLAGEYNMHNYAGYGLEFWKQLGKMIKEEDPYKRVIGAHPTPPGWGGGADAPQWSTAEVIHNESWLDYNQSQPGHGKWRNEMIPEIVTFAYQKTPPKPIVVTEPWYEFIEGNPDAIDVRFGAWAALMSGAAGHSYGGGHIWRGHLPESPGPGGTWPLDTSFSTNTMDYPGARAMSFMSELLQEKEWWLLEPHPEFVLENPSTYCLAQPGKEYLVYLRYGGTVVVDLSDYKSEFQYKWYELDKNSLRISGTINGGRKISLSPPEDYPGVLQYKDWLILIEAD